jgi:hypothetical protein
MAHFAELDENNIVTQVIVVNNNELLDDDGNESEAKGIAFLKNTFGSNKNYAQCSYNTWDNKYHNADASEHSDQSKAFRFRYPVIGMYFDASRDAFYWKECNHKKFVNGKEEVIDTMVFNNDTLDWDFPGQSLEDTFPDEYAARDEDRPWEFYESYEWDGDLYKSTGNGWKEKS